MRVNERSCLWVLCVAALPALVACGAAAEGDETTIVPRVSVDAFQREIDELGRALVERDTAALEGMVSSEVMSRSAERGIPMDTLLAKQRGALMRTFELEEGEIPTLDVIDVQEEGDAVRVTLAAQGVELEKPFYFVEEQGSYRLNIAPPGFSKAPPEGAQFGKSNYTIKNVNIPGNANFAMTCYQGPTTVVPPNSTRKMSCGDACGFWSGSLFANAEAYDGPQKACDWNAWGADVVINLLSSGGFYCADYC